MTVSQTKIQCIGNKPYDVYECRINSIVNGQPIEVRWTVSCQALEVGSDSSIKKLICIAIEAYIQHNNILASKSDVNELVDKMIKGMYEHIPMLKPKKPINVPNGWGPDKPGGGTGSVNGKPVSELSRKLPGVNTLVDFPCTCAAITGQKPLMDIIIHLNDAHNGPSILDEDKWSRERIAKWCDELHDSGIVNLEFQPWDSEGKEENG